MHDEMKHDEMGMEPDGMEHDEMKHDGMEPVEMGMEPAVKRRKSATFIIDP